jgi:hypothetical protein
VQALLRAGLFALFTAAVGFTLALATAESRNVGSAQPAAGLRAVGETLKITNPLFVAQSDASSGLAGDTLYPGGGGGGIPNGYDMGDVQVGAPFTRFVSAQGGFLPYTYEIAPLLGSAANVGGPGIPPIIPALDRTGKLSGLITEFTGSSLRYYISVTDFIGTSPSGLFKFNLIPTGQAHRFAVSQLPAADLAHNYFTNFETIGGQGAVSFSVTAGSIRAAGNAVEKLETLGLALSSDGTLYGRPLVQGDISFTLRGLDGAGVPALNRQGSAVDSTFLVQVANNTAASSELAGFSCQINGSLSKLGADTFSYSGLLDTKGDTAAVLAGSPFVVRVNGAKFSGTFDDKGKVQASIEGGGLLKASYSPQSGSLQIKLSGVDLTTPLGAASFTTRTTQNVVLLVEAGALRASEVLTAKVRVGGSRYQLDYALGKRGASSAGAFQIISVGGSDNKAGDGTRWKARFIAVPRGIDGATAADAISNGGSVTMRLGFDFQQTVDVALKSVRLEFKATDKDPGIFRLLLDPERFIHRLETNVLTETDTGISPATGALDPLGVFPLGMDLTGFRGETGRIIAPNRNRWIQR